MERQLKERLVGAAVLIAAAVIMVPEMFSGSGSHEKDLPKPAGNQSSDSSESGQVKTYRIELQQHEGAATSSVSSIQTLPVVSDTHADAIASTLPQSVPPLHEAESQAASSAAAQSATGANSSRSSTSNLSISHTAVAAATSESGWTVQLGSFAAEPSAKKVISDAKSHGFAAFHSAVKVGGKTLYRVRVGPYADRDAAEAALSKLKHSYAQASLVAPNH